MSLFATKSIERLLEESEGKGGHSLTRTLGAGQLVALGIGAIIGAGIFTLTGVAAAHHAGPAIVYSFILAAIGCAFAGLCYSEFSTMIPIAGSAYTYAYATMGELLAWIIGWALVLEYAVGAATVSVSWSGTVDSIFKSFGIHLPQSLIASPWDPNPGIMNLPAVFILMVISTILIIGIQESARFNATIVVVKVAVVILFIGLGYFFINHDNYVPFLPENTSGKFGEFGVTGVLAAAGQIFFAYIGFDAVSTAAQEAKNPKRDMPIGIVGSLIVCTILYILYALVLTGVVNYKDLNVTAPLAVAVDAMKYGWLGFVMKLGSLAGLTSVMLVMLLGQSRVFYSMSRDGLLPGVFSEVHPKFHTPWKSNLMLLVGVALLGAFTPIAQLGNLTSIGTLCAFVLVCIAVIIMRRTRPDLPRPFKTPLVPFVPILGVGFNLLLMFSLDSLTKIAFVIWMVIGLVIYFTYSKSRSHLQLSLLGKK
ncbi:amino acid permease [uncultured Paludibaculum sp.]|uniref:amino acid permease n=1 Tax=uncultured Paludibaculum sp. TaxID=1765020 RepID=UPI002AAA952F|nr:amino acid permease [uncultured Paludibaculum sp.]